MIPRPTPCSLPLRSVVMGCALVCCGAVQAQAEAVAAATPRVEVEALPHGLQTRSADPTVGRGLLETPRDGVRTRLWWGKGALEVGGGADLSNTSLAPGLAGRQTGTAVVGVRAELTQGAHLAFERETAVAPLAGQPPAAGAARLALEFKSVGNTKAKHPLSGGLLRVQMSSTSTLQLRPRGGGMSVTYRAQF